MKKIFLLPVLALSLLFGAGLTKDVNMAQAEEIVSVEEVVSSEEEVVFEQKVFTWEDKDATYKITLISEDTYTLEATHKETGTVISITDKYVLIGNTLNLYGQDETMFSFEILPDGTLKEIYGTPEVEYPCQVIIEEVNYGDIIVDREEGYVGDIVTIYAKPYTLCKLNFVTVNGVEIEATEEGVYQFALVEGENVICAEFSIDSEALEYVGDLLQSVKEDGLSQLFTMENLFKVLGILFEVLIGSGLIITLLKNKKIKSQTSQEIANAVNAIMENKSAEAINTFLKDTFAPIFEKLNLKIDLVDETCKSLARCFILAQENTPEARLAIIQELTKIQKSSEELAEQVRSIINLEVSKNEEIQNQKKKTLQELKEKNDNLLSSDVEDKENIEGRY